MISMPPKLIEELEKNLRIYSFLKKKFKNKFDTTPKEVRKKYNYDELMRLKKYASEENFIDKVVLLRIQARKNGVYSFKEKCFSL